MSAAKQGLTAQIHQYSEDTKRSLLSRAPAGIKSHSWLSNLNTTCTIKSAPPRTPEVMTMLGTKCGWLVKRNEQHVWQKRWCCVVPHTFLYYFEAPPEVSKLDEDGNYEVYSGGGVNAGVPSGAGPNGGVLVPPFPSTLDQEALNVAVREGYDEGGNNTSIMSLYPSLMIMGGGNGNNQDENGLGVNTEWDPDSTNGNVPLSPEGNDGSKPYQFVSSSNLQPVGIIDLECYSAVNRSNINPTVLELAGDAVTNPDLRSFYFQSCSVEDAESWTKALLSDRHQGLKDETEAYRQVCESFPLQLQNCSQMIDAAEAKAEKMEKETYNVRSQNEEGRRRVVGVVREMLERRCWDSGRNAGTNHYGLELETKFDQESKETDDLGIIDSVLNAHYEKMETNRTAFLREFEAALASPNSVATSNVLPPVQTLVDYTAAVVGSFGDLRTQLQKYESELSTSAKEDQSQLQAMKNAIEGRNAQLADVERQHTTVVAELRNDLQSSNRQIEELTKQVEAQRMEFSMYQNATKTKLSELQQHKKILKREVIDLRKKIDESESENTALQHSNEKIKSSFEAMKDKNSTLERYIDRLEKQVGVQQNMMEMMSQTGGASFVGKIVGPGVTSQDQQRDGGSVASMGSHFRRPNSGLDRMNSANSSIPPGARMTSPPRPRPLLPPESGSIRRSMHDVSPLPTPTVFKEGNSLTKASFEDAVANIEDGEERDIAYYRSEPSTSATEAESSSPGAVMVNDCEDQNAAISTSSPSKHSSTITPANCDIYSALDPTESKKLSPNQSNSDSVHRYVVKNTATMDSDALHTLDVNNVETKLASASFHDEDDDDDDNASRVSDITEDRTQRQIDDDLAERRKILLAYVKKASSNGNSNMSIGASTQRRLDTIENLLPNATNSVRESGGLDTTNDSLYSGASSGKLSVAQRARLKADSAPNLHHAPSQGPTRKEDASISARSSGSTGDGNSRSETVRSRPGEFFSRLGQAIEKAVDNSVLGVVPQDDESYEEAESEIVSDVMSEASTTLATRIAKQRERQVAFLKNKGLIDDEACLRGGAGASPSSKSPTPRRGMRNLSTRRPL